MGVRNFRPTSSGRRFMSVSDFVEITKGTPEKALLEPHPSTGGRNAYGRITSRFRGGGHKRRYRRIDFRRDKLDIPARVASVEYDPNRSARIALLVYTDGEKRYILAPYGLEVGKRIESSRTRQLDVLPGNAMPLKLVPPGTFLHNVELQPGGGGQIARGAGTQAQLMAKEGSRALLRLPSGELRYLPQECMATVGQVGNLDLENLWIGKAGRSRWLGRRPHNRGVSMNPVDHPHGGGEGKSGQGNPHPVTPWGLLTKGYKTRKPKNSDRWIVQRRG